jgi:fumarylacetoacetate (FAA) hydrolase family protein
MVFLRMARKTGRKRKYLSLARRKSMNVVRAFKESPNAKPLLLLLEAEYAAVRGCPGPFVQSLFDVAIESAAQADFVQIEALANECASKASSEESSEAAERYISEAVELYDSWDAIAQVECLEEQRH